MDNFTGDRMFFGQQAAFNFVQDSDRADRMLVGRVNMVHVILHLGDHAAEIRHKFTQQAAFIHVAQRQVR